MIDEKILNRILKSREDRSKKQIELIDRYHMSLISFTLNTPGSIKDSPMYRSIHGAGISAILEKLEEGQISIVHREESYRTTGPETYIVVDIDPLILKEITVDIEEYHPLGRVFDIDVFDSHHNQISRTHIERPSRRCLLCDDDARVCMRMQRHRYEELIHWIEQLWSEYRDTLENTGFSRK